jgi:hypothetical protein
MEYTFNKPGDVVYVTTTRAIKVDQTLRINPSEAYLGIEPGVVRVTFIGTMDEIQASDLDDVAKEQAIFEQGTMMDNTDDTEELDRLENGIWVVYQYSNLDADKCSLPLEEFVEHTMRY